MSNGFKVVEVQFPKESKNISSIKTNTSTYQNSTNKNNEVTQAYSFDNFLKLLTTHKDSE